MYQSRRENNHKVSLKYKQLKNAEIERNMDTPQRRAHQFYIQYQVVSTENIQVILYNMYVCVCIYVQINN